LQHGAFHTGPHKPYKTLADLWDEDVGYMEGRDFRTAGGFRLALDVLARFVVRTESDLECNCDCLAFRLRQPSKPREYLTTKGLHLSISGGARAWCVTAEVMHLDHLDHEIRAARATQRDRWRREQGLPPETPEPARSDEAPPPLTSWEDLGNEATRAADERDVAEAVERAIEERDRRRRGMLFTTALGAGILGHTLVGATRSIGRALQRWGSGEHSLDELMGVPPETRARRAQMRGDERLARRIQREERIAAMSAGQPNYAPPMGTRDNPVRFDESDDDDDDTAGGNPNFTVREWRTPFGNFRFAVNRGGASDGNGAPPRLRTTQGDDVEALLHRMMAGGAWGGADNGHDVFAFHEWMRTRGGNSNSSASDGNATSRTPCTDRALTTVLAYS
jgi:hypothetical protein